MMHKPLFALLLITLFSAADAENIKLHTKQWNTLVYIGSFNESNVRYYIEPQLRFIDSKYKFEETFVLLGLGFRTSPYTLFFAGAGRIESRTSEGVYTQENRFWQQFNANGSIPNEVALFSRSRLEERKRLSEPDIALRFRQRVMLRIPIKRWDGHELVSFEEAFFYLNRPVWVTNRFFEQNRIFVGLGTVVAKNATVDIGYLNQYQFTHPAQMSNSLLVTISVSDG